MESGAAKLSHVVVVGTSLAGLRAVEGLRRLGYAGALTWVGEEAHAPYDRPPLSKQLLLGTWDPDQLRFRRKQGYSELDLNLMQGIRVDRLEAGQDRLTLSSGKALEFDGLVIATGARARQLQGVLPTAGIHLLRTLDDAIALRNALRQGGPRVVIVGAGFIGLEVASACRTLGLSVTMVEQAELPLARIVGAEMAQTIVDLHKTQGVVFHTGVAVERLLGETHVEGVQLAGGELVPADLVVVGIGVQPNVEWLHESGVALDNGVQCDSRCATSRRNVVACGDVASFYNERFSVRQRVEHWTHAVEMAGAAASRLLGGPEVPAFSPVPYFWSDQYDVKVQFAGHVAATDTVSMLEGSPRDRKFTTLYGHDGQLTGVLTWNSPTRLIRFRQAIADGVSVQEARAL